MSKELSGTATWVATVTCPVVGDARTPASVEAGLQDATDREAYLKDRLGDSIGVGSVTRRLLATLQTVNPVVSTLFWYWAEPYWTFYATDTAGHADALVFPLSDMVPGGAIITGVSVRLDPAGSHGDLPQYMPALYLKKLTSGAPTVPTVIDSATDDSVDVAAYEAAHDLEITGLTETHSLASAYYLYLTGEYGTNSEDGLKVYEVTVTYTSPVEA